MAIDADVRCPHCKAELDVTDHYESGELPCPQCRRRVLVEVEYIATFEVSCIEEDHRWVSYVPPGPQIAVFERCQNCETIRVVSDSPV